MSDPHDLQRFVDAQRNTFDAALAELRAAAKRGHWMWFVFPQLAGLGRSPTAQFFALASLNEARAYLLHWLLGSRLRQCVEAILPWSRRQTAEQIFGSADAMKLRSSLTLFDQVEQNSVFRQALAAFFDGEPDARTLALLNAEE